MDHQHLMVLVALGKTHDSINHTSYLGQRTPMMHLVRFFYHVAITLVQHVASQSDNMIVLSSKSHSRVYKRIDAANCGFVIL